MSAPDLEAFLRQAERVLGLPPNSVDGSTLAIAELQLDSLHLVELALLVDESSDTEIPEGLLLQDDFTLGQVHHYLTVQQGHHT